MVTVTDNMNYMRVLLHSYVTSASISFSMFFPLHYWGLFSIALHAWIHPYTSIPLDSLMYPHISPISDVKVSRVETLSPKS